MLGHRLGGMRYTCCACVSAMGWDGSARASGGRGTVRGVAQLRDLNGKALELHAEVLDGLRILCAHRGISGNSMHHSRSTNDRLPGKKAEHPQTSGDGGGVLALSIGLRQFERGNKSQLGVECERSASRRHVPRLILPSSYNLTRLFCQVAWCIYACAEAGDQSSFRQLTRSSAVVLVIWRRCTSPRNPGRAKIVCDAVCNQRWSGASPRAPAVVC